MSSWRDQILSDFVPEVSRLTLVADPDALLLEEGILGGIRERGFELIRFEDHVAFRYAYESSFRSRWDHGEALNLVVALHAQLDDLESIPYDLLHAGRRLSFHLGDIFPTLSYPVISALDQRDLDLLFTAQEEQEPGQMGDNATKAFVLDHVFGFVPSALNSPSDLMRALLRYHESGRTMPEILSSRLVQLLDPKPAFKQWPLELVITERRAFLDFLQGRWPLFLDQFSQGSEAGVRETVEAYGLQISGPELLPFDHPDLIGYIQRLFVTGELRPVRHEVPARVLQSWVRVGLIVDPQHDRSKRLRALVEQLVTTIPPPEAMHQAWMAFARVFAEQKAGVCQPGWALPEDLKIAATSLETEIDTHFTEWLTKRYSGLWNLPAKAPVMVHHIVKPIHYYLEKSPAHKAALLVIDGLALDQWCTIRDALLPRMAGIRCSESSVFAWIPTITSVSRQAIFAGKAPNYFPQSIQKTDKEPNLWSQFWVEHGHPPNAVVYRKGLGDGDLQEVETALSHPKVRIAGLVIDKVDRIMHGMELGAAGMHGQVLQWMQGGYLESLLTLLLSKGFRVFLTSDHGNVEAVGVGKPLEGAAAKSRGERVRVFENEALREGVHSHFLHAIPWPVAGLPPGYFPLLAAAREAFVGKGVRVVSHGGLTIEEVIVPFIEIDRGLE